MYDEFVEIGFLFDFYGKTLTEKQREIIDLYYFKDLSLAEIGENLNISRQAVYDNLKRGERQLRQMEEQLGLVERFLAEKNKWEETVHKMELVIGKLREECSVSPGIIQELEELREAFCDILGG